MIKMFDIMIIYNKNYVKEIRTNWSNQNGKDC